jgi:hypothetical protein
MSRLDDLRELRDWLHAWIPEAPVDRRAALVGQYRATLEEIEALAPKEAVGDGIDEVKARRDARRSGAAEGSRRSGRSR